MLAADLTRLIALVVVCTGLSGCAGYSYTFNQAQTYLDELRYVRGTLAQGRLP
jgi:hypothetical protein